VGGDVVRITQLGTGNYNEKTAGLYADYSFMTADKRIGEDANRFFRNLQIGNLEGDYSYLGVAPAGLKPLIMQGINREMAKARAGEDAYLCFKMNSLTDREVIDRLSEASQAGVKVDLVIRGISCLVPGVPGKTENVAVRSVVGRMLEHARVYLFGRGGEAVFLSSADMMTRNTEHRVEIAYPVLDPRLRERVAEDLALQLADTVKARELGRDGTYRTVAAMGTPPFDSQEYFMRRAVENGANAVRPRAAARPAAGAGTPEAERPRDGDAGPAAQGAPDGTRAAPEAGRGFSAAGPDADAGRAQTVAVEVVPRAEGDAAALEPAGAVELMVRQKGRGATGWALIKMGLRVLFGRNVYPK
jgi:polyphosphate kinase